MNKAIFLHYMDVEPADAKERYIFIVDNEEIALAIMSVGFKSVFLAGKDNKYQYSIDSFLKYLDEIGFQGKCRADYVYIMACCSKKTNDRLEQYFKTDCLKNRQGWQLFKNKEYLANSDKAKELKGVLEDFIRRFEGDGQQPDLSQFHLKNDKGIPTGVFDEAIFQYIKRYQELFVCGGTVYIYEGGYFKADSSGARLKTMIGKLIYPQFIKSTTLKRVYDRFLCDISLEVSFEDLNCYPAHWICFKNGMYDCKEKRLLPHSPKYRAINQVPHEYKPDAVHEGKRIEEFLNFVCPDPDSREMLLQFSGYAHTKDVSQQKFLVLLGDGGSGKSTFIRLMEASVGNRNLSNISLTDLQQRFASFGLMGKLLNSCADLEISALEDTSVIKKVLGEDTLRAEQKGRDAISFKNYAKLIFSTNELPTVKAEKTNGFYRRLLILPMNRVPEKKNPSITQIY